MDNKKVKAEEERLKSILRKAEIPEQKQAALEVVIQELAWQRIKLEETRKIIKNSEVVIPYDNGGGQTGIRQNPIFKGYNELWRGYLAGLDKFTSYIPQDLQEEVVGTSITVLEKVASMKKKGTA